MKLGMYWRYATRSLTRGGQRTILAIFCVTVGVLAIVALQLVANMVNASFTTNVRESNGGDLSVRSDFSPFSQQQLGVFQQLQDKGTITAYTAISAHDGAQSVDKNGNTQFYDLRAIDPSKFPLAGAPVFESPSNSSFSALLSNDTVVVTDTLLKQLNLHQGDSLTVESDDGRSLQVTIGGVIASAGIFRTPQMLISLQDYAAASSTSGLPVGYNAVYANVPGDTNANAATAKDAITRALPLATVTTSQDALSQYQSQVEQIRQFLQIFGLLALLIGGVGIINTMQVLLRRRRTEIAMLKTAGYSRLDLFSMFAIEAALLGFIGGVIGSAAGVGVSLLLRTLFENAFFITLPLIINPLIVLSGILIGVVTALIFGIMPIAQASQVRPLAVLRELPEGAGAAGVVLTGVLLLVVAALFFVFALVILGNPVLTAISVIGTAVFLALLAVVFTLVVLVIAALPVPERFTWWYILLIAIASAISIALLIAVPPFGILLAALSLVGIVVVLLPRTWKSNVKMGLRNIGRQRARSVTTMVALFIGVFAIGLILSLGQDIKEKVNDVLNTQLPYNSFIIAGGQTNAAVTQALDGIPGTNNRVVNIIAGDTPVSIDGVPIATVLQNVPKQSTATEAGREETLAYLSSVTGYDVTNPDPKQAFPNITASQGRNLTPADANANSVVMPARAFGPPLNLHVGSTIVVLAQDQKTLVTLTVVGFVSPSSPVSVGGSTFVSDNTALALSAGHPQYFYSLKLDPNQATQILHQVQHDVPGTQVFSVAEFAQAFLGALNSILLLLSALSSLALIAGLVVIANAVALAMLERRRELGILKAVGHTSRSVLGEVLLENSIMGFAGALMAMLLVTLALTVLGLLVFKTNLGVGAPLVLILVLATGAVCMIVAAIVAWQATRVRPLEVLRYE